MKKENPLPMQDAYGIMQKYLVIILTSKMKKGVWERKILQYIFLPSYFRGTTWKFTFRELCDLSFVALCDHMGDWFQADIKLIYKWILL